tara:strand:+ start:2336 stop:2782 length:447 start_codon:yes stop_codon:yes gene_type:complete
MPRVVDYRLKAFSLVEIMIVVALIGILAAIALPKYMMHQSKARQAEARTNLKSLYSVQLAYFAEQASYHSDFDTLGWAVDGGRYTYHMGGGTAGKIPGVKCATNVGGASDTAFTAQACGQIDTDSTVDDWYITDASSVPINQLNDVSN